MIRQIDTLASFCQHGAVPQQLNAMQEQPLQTTPQEQSISIAARKLFSQYGYKRVSLEEIANEAGMSRSGIYNYFRNKEDILKSITNEINAVSHARAEAIAASDKPLVEKLDQIFKVKLVDPFSDLHGTPHGDALTDPRMKVTSKLIEDWGNDFVRLVAKVLRQADKQQTIELRQLSFTPESAARFLVSCARGLKTSGTTPLAPEEYGKRINKLVKVSVIGFGGSL